MADPILITALVAAVINLILSFNSSIKSNHFKSKCSDCCEIELDTIHKDTTVQAIQNETIIETIEKADTDE